MNQKNTIFTAIFLAAGALAASVTGCELIASVDRSMIAGTGGSGGHVTTGGTTASSTTASTTTTSTTGSGGGTGGAMCVGSTKCGNPQECPDPMTECITRTCDGMGCCGKSNVANGVATMNGQTAGNCMKQVCDGNGATMMAMDPTDVPANMDDCHTGVCMAGVPGQTADALGTACTSNGGKVCADPAGTSAGKCVACNVTADCTAGNSCNTASNTCVAVGCTNGIQDGNETDKDCGGSCGATCADGLHCAVNGDCLNTYCKAGICTAPSCTDGVVDGNETAVDCGGAGYKGAAACPKCADTLACKASTDCTNGFCNPTTMKCATPTCSDGFQNNGETGVDCGGATCDALGKKCGAGSVCVNANDCTSGFCNVGMCALKPPGTTCGAGAECMSTFCVEGVCCGSACASGCDTCNGATPGTCAPITVGNNPVAGKTTCATTAQATCGTDGKCDGAGACRNWPATTVCRASAGACDVAENCNGMGACPADAFLPNSTVCSGATGLCDTAATCTGTSAACPANGFKQAGTTCGVSMGPCDVAATCTGAAASCPANGFKPNTTVCRAAVGTCDIPEDCTGSSAACPADVIVAKGGTSAVCSGNNACDGVAGLNTDCKLANGQTCNLPTDCASGVCTMVDAGSSICQ